MARQEIGNRIRPLLTAKLRPPLRGESVIPRSHLDERFRSAFGARLVLVHSPAGFGKTTAMLQWLSMLRQLGDRTSWLSVDDGDNDPGRFLDYLLAAFRRVDPALDLDELAPARFEGGSATSGLLLTLVRRLDESSGPFTLFLDDFERIRNPEVTRILKEVLDHLPRGGRLVIAAREAPDIGLARMRIWGQLVEIETEDLRFAPEETERFLREAHGLALDDEDLARLHRCAEGWAAGLQLAALSLAGRPHAKEFLKSFSGSSTEIADYLAEDVLSRQPEDVRAFLLQTCILDALCGPLCDALTGGSDGYAMLGRLERANLFIVPIDHERYWYRYHNLFAQYLRTRLARGIPGMTAGLHRSAAAWFSRQGRYVEAAEHALAGGEVSLAAGAIETCAMDFIVMGQFGTIADWVNRLPSEVLDRYPKLRLAYAWTLTFQGAYEKAHAVADQIRCGRASEELDEAAWSEVGALEAVNLGLADRIEEAHRAASDGLRNARCGGSFARGNLSVVLGFSLISCGRFDEAREILRQARESHAEGGSILGVVFSHCLKGVSELIQGRLQAATTHYRSAYARVSGVLPGLSRPGAVAAVFLADALYEANELEEAERLLSGQMELFREYINMDTTLCGFLTLARLRWMGGRHADALALLEEAERLGAARNWPRMCATVRLERARLALQFIGVDAAERACRRSDDRRVWKSFEGYSMPANDLATPALHQLRLLVRKGQPDRAMEGLKAELARAQAERRLRRALKLKILQAEALSTVDERRSSLRTLTDAVRFAEPEGFIRIFADEGTTVIRLVRKLRESAGTVNAFGLSRREVSFLDRILLAAGEEAGWNGAPGFEPAGDALDEITAREIEIIALVARGLSNRDLADRLFVSENTVKFHLRNVNSKLGAKNRTEAVAKARSMGLIS